MTSGNIINIVFHSDKHQCLMFDISRYREEIKIKEKSIEVNIVMDYRWILC